MKRKFLWLGFAAITIGLFVLIYHGPGRAVLRGHVGDVAAAMLVYATIGALSPQTWIRFRAFTTFAFATLIEFGQSFWSAGSVLGELTIGDTFDPWDILAYAIGVVICVACELCWRSQDVRASAVAPSPQCASSP
ncbi:MAG: DUF2809 domain-containing protein [Myxococcota bacterium]|nr:DUF2809 domain-containing protein [Myxococcota bacterium]